MDRISKDNCFLIKDLRQENFWILDHFWQNFRTKCGVERIFNQRQLKKVDRTGTAESKQGSEYQRSALTETNIRVSEELISSKKDKPQTYKGSFEIARHADISHFGPVRPTNFRNQTSKLIIWMNASFSSLAFDRWRRCIFGI